MSPIELICLAIVAQFLWVRTRSEPSPGPVLRRMGLLGLAAWIGEDTCIRVYGLYHYDGPWQLWLDVTPIVVPLIWPVVIHSAWDLARHLRAGSKTQGRWTRTGVALLASALVLADAAFIEPVAVACGLWHWTEPGLFGVPIIGILGWSFFALVALTLLELQPLLAERPGGWLRLVVLAPLGCHALLLATWWGALRWVSAPVPELPAVSLVGVVGLGLAALSWRLRLRQRVPLPELASRIPAALFFIVLLAGAPGATPLLWAWVIAFVPPWLTLIDRARRHRPVQGQARTASIS